jgi:hypothetical protein
MNYAFMHTLPYVLFFSFLVSLSQFSNAATVSELAAAVKAANPKEAEHLTVKLEEQGKRKILKVGRKMILNPLRHVIQVQVVNLKDVEKTPSVEKIGSQLQPWVKLRCIGGKANVQVIEEVYVEGELMELESTDETGTVLVIPCDPYEIEKLTAVLADFLAEN